MEYAFLLIAEHAFMIMRAIHIMLWIALISVIVSAIVSVILHEVDRLVIMIKYGGIILACIALTITVLLTL
jgi:hypothetical protein